MDAGVSGATIAGGGVPSVLGRTGTNRVADHFGTVGGGVNNLAGLPGGGFQNGWFATVGGGQFNRAEGVASTIGGGSENRTSGNDTTVGGGWRNEASAGRATVSGGEGNVANGDYSAIAGGVNNRARGLTSAIAGGELNSAAGDRTAVGGGVNNFAGGDFGAIGGGVRNCLSNILHITGGGEFPLVTNLYPQPWATIAGGLENTNLTIGSTIGGGVRNLTSFDVSAPTFGYSTIAGGAENRIVGSDRGTIGGGSGNRIQGNPVLGFAYRANLATVAGGQNNVASGAASTVGGGNGNSAAHNDATVGGGLLNTASGVAATVAGGNENVASGSYAIIPGGVLNWAPGDFSFAAGRRAKAVGAGSFVWADSTDADFGYGGDNKFQVRASGGVLFYADPAGTNGVHLAPGGNSGAATSDRNAKENFREINPLDVLAKVVALPILNYNLKSQTNTIRHLGPMAQDFYAAFELGEDNKHITTIDADGVALAAIQGLNQRIEERRAESEAKGARIAMLEKKLAEMQETAARWDSRLKALEQALARSPAIPSTTVSATSETRATR